MTTTFRPHLRRLGATLALSLFVVTAFTKTQDQPYYQAIDLGALGGINSVANGINNNGIVVGTVQYQDGHVQAFYWSPTTGIQRLDPSAKQSRALAINDRNIVAGALTDRNRLTTAVRWSLSGQSTIIAEAPFGAFATAINTQGDVVGFREDGVFVVTENAFSWPPKDPSFAWNDLFDDDSQSFAQSINDKGQIVGYLDRQAFLLNPNGKLKILAGDPLYGAPAYGVDINNKSEVLISQWGAGFLYTNNKLNPIVGPGPVYPLALNDAGQVVGYVDTGNRSAFVWSKANGLSLIDDLLVTRGWQISAANAINENGWIAGVGFHNGRERAVLLVPVKAPARVATP